MSLRTCFRAFLLTVLCAATFAQADTLKFTGVVTGTTLKINDSTLGTVTGYIDPYKGVLNGQPVIMFCVDPDHDVNLNDLWNVYITQAPTLDWSKTFQYQDGNPNTANTYGEMAYLSNLMLKTSNASQQQAIQAVIWELADAGLTAYKPSGFATQADWQNAQNAYRLSAQNNVWTGGFKILTDTRGLHSTSKQEYLVLTPEPSSLGLLASGMIFGLGLVRRKRLA
jgi:hypothetical protein